MFSRRVPGDHSANPLSALIEQKRAGGEPIIDLTESNPTRCGFHYDEHALLAALANPGGLVYEPHPQGLPAARDAVAGYYAEIGSAADPESLFLTTGTSEAYTQVFKLLADPGDEILVPTPGYPLLDVLTGLEALRLVAYPLAHADAAGWAIDLEGLRSSISTRSRAIVAISPNNPTGSFLKRDELEACNELCREFGLALIVDEVFSDYGRGVDPARVRTASTNEGGLTFTLNGFSKLVGLPQLKLGWIRVSGPRRLAEQACERLAFVTDAFLSVSAAAQHAAPVVFRMRTAVQDQVNRRLAENGRILEECLSGLHGCRVLDREGGWYAVVKIADKLSDENLSLRLLKEDGVLVHPGYLYDFSAGSFLVISLLPQAGAFAEGAARLAARLRLLSSAS